MSAPAALAMGGLSALQGSKANASAQKSADKAQANQAALIKRVTDLFDLEKGIVTKADQAGQFDPTRQINQLNQDTDRYESRDGGNTAAAYRVAGYQPGDTPESNALEDVKVKYRAQREGLDSQIRNNAFMQKLGAYSSINPQGLGMGIGAYGNQQQIALGQMQNPGGFFGSVSPFLNNMNWNAFKMGGGGGLKTPATYGSGTTASGDLPRSQF